jgi:Domain of unknown function (DUF4383)
MEGPSPARLYATLIGGALVVTGIIGFFYDASFDTGDSLQADDVFGVLAVNGWHNIVHILTGALGLLVAGYAAREYALGLGVVYLVVAFAGFAHVGGGDTDSILKLIPVNTEDNVLHLVLGLLGVGAGVATPKGGRRGERERPAARASARV